MNPAELRAQFPVLERTAYLNAGTCGPLARSAVDAARAELDAALAEGRAQPHFARMMELRERLRAAYAERVGGRPEDVALTGSTSEGIVRVLAGLGLGRGDEVVTSDEEHPGLLGPLAAAQQRFGIEVKTVPFADLADAVGPRTRLVACSHVSWVGGAVAPTALAELGDDVPVLLDGAQGAGAVAVDVDQLGCAFYAAAGQKWLCGPVGAGLLHVAARWADRLPSIGPTYVNLDEPAAGLGAVAHADARRHDAAAQSVEATALALAAHDALAAFGWPELHARATGLAARLADGLRAAGREVAPRGHSTLVSWVDADPPATKARLAEVAVVVRDLPGHPYLRASVGAWNDEDDLSRLIHRLT